MNDERVPGFAKRLRRVRLTRGMSQRQLSAAAKVEQGNLSRYENDEATPSLPVFFRIVAALKTRAELLVDMDGIQEEMHAQTIRGLQRTYEDVSRALQRAKRR